MRVGTWVARCAWVRGWLGVRGYNIILSGEQTD